MGRPAQEQNLLVMVPHQGVEFLEGDDGLVTLLRPRFVRGPFARWLQPRVKKPFFNVHLDERGTRVWKLIDGERTVGQIAEVLGEGGAEEDDLVDRLAVFLRDLEGGAMIRYA